MKPKFGDIKQIKQIRKEQGLDHYQEPVRKIEVVNECMYCGGEARATYRSDHEFGKCLAEVVDICGKCYKKLLTNKLCKL